MTYQEVIDALREGSPVEVNPELTAGERKAVREGLAAVRVYQDQPADVPYPFRPKKYMLIRRDPE